MNISLKQFFGWLFLILFALPTLFASIWAVGMTQGALSKEVLADVPRKIIPQVPDLIDLSFEEAQKPGAVTNPNTIAWIDVMAKQETTPRQLLEQTGMFAWLNTEVSSTFGQLGEIVEGRAPVQDIQVNLKPFKEAMQNPQVQSYLFNVVQSLPACTPSQQEVWQIMLENRNQDQKNEMPACNPGLEVLNQAAVDFQNEIQNIPDQTQATQGMSNPNQPINIGQTVTSLASITFILPTLFLLIGVYLVSTLWSKRIRWAGLTVLMAGLSVLAIATIARNSANLALATNPVWLSFTNSVNLSAQYQQAISQRIIPVIAPIIDDLFNPVINLAMWATMGGLLAFLASFLIPENQAHVRVTPSVPTQTTKAVDANEATSKKRPMSKRGKE